MSNYPIIINDAWPVRSFHALLLSEGFQRSDENLFYDYCEKLKQGLFVIPPFDFLKDKMDVRYHFSTSGVSGVTDSARDTAYKFFKNGDGNFITNEPGRIVDTVKDLTLKVTDKQNIVDLKAEDIWLNPATKRSRVVCIVFNNPELSSSITRSFFNTQSIYSPSEANAIRTLLPYIAVSLWPLHPLSVPKYHNPEAALAALFARELGRFFGLEYEYEKEEAAFERYDDVLPSLSPNLITHDSLLQGVDLDNLANGASIDISSIKDKLEWYHLVPSNRNTQCRKYNHPTAPDDGKESEYEAIRDATRDSIALLTHQAHAADPQSTANLHDVRYVDGVRSSLMEMREPNIVEGGGYYRRRIYRPAPECLMRWLGYDRLDEQGRRTFVVVPYCKVCLKHVLSRIGGFYHFQLKGVRIKPDPTFPRDQKMDSTLGKKFVEYIEDTEEACTWNRMACVAATYRRLEAFFHKALKWSTIHWFSLMPKVGTEDQVKEDWGGRLTMQCPVLLNGNTYIDEDNLPSNRFNLAVLLWVNNLPVLRRHMEQGYRDYLVDYVGAGAAGAIAYSGLGRIRNEPEYNTELNPDGDEIVYVTYKNFSDDEFDDLAPGSIIQLWSDEQAYLDAVRYINGITSVQVAPAGHSIIYMGNDKIADQFHIDTDLDVALRNFEFRIVAEFYDAENIPPRRKWADPNCD